MFKLMKKIKDLEKRLTEIEKRLMCVNNSTPSQEESASYKEVLDEWLNGKRS